MRVMLDTNVLVSAAVLSSNYLLRLIDELAERHTIVLSTYVIDELKKVTREKFPSKAAAVGNFLLELPYELVYTPEEIDPTGYPEIRDIKDLPVLATAINEDVDILLTNDDDLTVLELERPEIIEPQAFVEKHGDLSPIESDLSSDENDGDTS
jgi:putative PIN family toxin of toxin-antitoxin system